MGQPDHRDPADPVGVLGVGVRPGLCPGPTDSLDPVLGGLFRAVPGLFADHAGLRCPPRRGRGRRPRSRGPWGRRRSAVNGRSVLNGFTRRHRPSRCPGAGLHRSVRPGYGRDDRERQRRPCSAALRAYVATRPDELGGPPPQDLGATGQPQVPTSRAPRRRPQRHGRKCGMRFARLVSDSHPGNKRRGRRPAAQVHRPRPR